VRLAPQDAATLKALGFVRSAQGEFDGALETYRRALAFDRDAWGVMINLGDVLEITGKPRDALPWFEQAYAAMSRSYDREALRIRPWQAELGVAIAQRHAELGQGQRAETWYRKVLTQAPLHRGATKGLAKLLAGTGDATEAQRLCRELVERTGPDEGCKAYL
jgi:Flp pilus assembly protein TadD